MAFVKIKNLRKTFGGVVAVDDVSLEVADGQTLALLGPSGCGKTTILRCVAGLETANAGSIEIAGTVVFDQAAGIDLMPEQRELGIVFQSYAVWPHMTVADNVAFPLRVRRMPKAELRERTGRILDLVGLSAVKDNPATALSGGQQQRVALARALIHEPRLVLFDEPMSNLDARLRAQMRMELNVLQDRLGFTAIYVTHDQAEAFALADTVAVMNTGRVETIGGPRTVFQQPATPFVADFLGLNVLCGRVIGTAHRAGAASATLYAEVEVADGLALWGAIAGGRPLRKGMSALVSIRKEHVGIRPRGAAAAMPVAIPPVEQTFPAVIRAVSFLGLAEEYIAAIGDTEFGSVQPANHLAAGTAVELVLHPDDCFVFADASTHARLD